MKNVYSVGSPVQTPLLIWGRKMCNYIIEVSHISSFFVSLSVPSPHSQESRGEGSIAQATDSKLVLIKDGTMNRGKIKAKQIKLNHQELI